MYLQMCGAIINTDNIESITEKKNWTSVKMVSGEIYQPVIKPIELLAMMGLRITYVP